jgi:hypothetical protein
MTTSGETAWELTARDFVKHAMQELGVLSSGEEPEASELADCIVRLNAMLKSWSTKANLFREATGEVTTVGGEASGALPPEIRDISGVRLVVSATQERLLYPWQRSQYLSLPNKDAVGAPTIYYVSQQAGGDVLHLWPVPAASVTLKIDYSRTAETVTNAGETLDILQEWHEAVYLGLAARIAGMFGATRIDPGTVADVKQRAEALYQQLLDSDRPDSYFFGPSEYCAYG